MVAFTPGHESFQGLTHHSSTHTRVHVLCDKRSRRWLLTWRLHSRRSSKQPDPQPGNLSNVASLGPDMLD